MTIFQFTQKVEGIFENEVKKLLPNYWDENLLTQNFFLRLSLTLRSVNIIDLDGISRYP